MSRINPWNRPAIGFIVEGAGEYYCYPSFAAKILDKSGIHIPVENAGGCGGIARNLPYYLDNLVIAHYPFNIIVTVDLDDVIELHLYENCESLKQDLLRQASEWMEKSISNHRLHPLPNKIEVVIQVKKFETWLIADSQNLTATDCFDNILEEMPSDVDSITNPNVIIKKYIKPHLTVKKPVCAKKIASKLDPVAMKQNSRSFNKFYREIVKLYEEWLDYCIKEQDKYK